MTTSKTPSSERVIPHQVLENFLAELRSSLQEFNHQIRSPLTVLNGIVEDLESGKPLGSEDIEDGRLALTRTREHLNSLKTPLECLEFAELSFEDFREVLNRETAIETAEEHSINFRLSPIIYSKISNPFLLPLIRITKSIAQSTISKTNHMSALALYYSELPEEKAIGFLFGKKKLTQAAVECLELTKIPLDELTLPPTLD